MSQLRSPQLHRLPLPSACTPRMAIRRLAPCARPVLLESQGPLTPHSRWSYLAVDPIRTGRAERGAWIEVDAEGRMLGEWPDPLARLEASLAEFGGEGMDLSLANDRPRVGAGRGGADEQVEGDAPPPFIGGWVGYLGYELATWYERLPRAPDGPPDLPDAELGLYDTVLAWDRARDQGWILAWDRPEPSGALPASGRGRAEALLDRLVGPAHDAMLPPTGQTLTSALPLTSGPPLASAWPLPPGAGVDAPHPSGSAPSRIAPRFRPLVTRSEYETAVERVRRMIGEGEVFQVNLSQRFEAPSEGAPLDFRERAAALTPAPFSAFLDLGEQVIVSASPELFLSVRGREIETRPIKGTRPRSPDSVVDREAAAQLVRSPKDRAENVMIVDLMRNDLSSVCDDESVRVAALCELETHPTVHHLVSTVRGTLRRGVGVGSLLRATFPCGSITGAPKLRAIEIAAALEPRTRGVYTGAIGWMGFDGSTTLSVAIRTAVLERGVVHLSAGGGVVHDSDPAAEFDETMDKARALLEAARGSSAEPPERR